MNILSQLNCSFSSNNKEFMKINHVLFLLVILSSCEERVGKSEFLEQLNSPRESKMALVNDFEEQAANDEGDLLERKLIKNGSITFESQNVQKTKIEIEKICKELNAYVVNEGQNNYGDRLQYSQTIRVSANRFDELLLKIEPLASIIEDKTISTQDITEEFIDVEARLETKKELELRYREILKQAKTVADIISIEAQIANVRSEIESMEGRLNYLKNQVSFSTLNVTYYETIGTDFGFASKFVRSLRIGWDNLLSFLIFTLSFWPFILVGGGTGIWWWKRKKSKISLDQKK